VKGVLLGTGACLITMQLPGCGAQQTKFFRSAGHSQSFYSDRYIVDRRAKRVVALSDGRIVLFGGTSSDPALPVMAVACLGRPNDRMTEIYDPRTQRSERVSDSPYELCRSEVQVTVLPSGKVLITGPNIGDFGECSGLKSQQEIDACERTTSQLYNPKTQEYRRLFNLRPIRAGATTTPLSDGRLLLIGGEEGRKEQALLAKAGRKSITSSDITREDVALYARFSSEQLRAVQIYDPDRDVIQKVGFLPYSFKSHRTTQVDRNRFPIIGGVANIYSAPLPDIQVYDLSKDHMGKVGQLNFPRTLHTTVRLGNGHFLLVGGTNQLVLEKVSSHLADKVKGIS